MLIVSVKLLSAITGQETELARMHICNKGDTPDPNIGNYDVRTLRGRDKDALDNNKFQRHGEVIGHPRLRSHVWNLVQKALASMKYGDDEHA